MFLTRLRKHNFNQKTKNIFNKSLSQTKIDMMKLCRTEQCFNVKKMEKVFRKEKDLIAQTLHTHAYESYFIFFWNFVDIFKEFYYLILVFIRLIICKYNNLS